MAGFFSLGGGGSSSGEGGREQPNHHQQQQQNNNEIVNPWGNSSLVLYRNEEIHQKGFEIWQQYVQVHHHHHPPSIQKPDYHHLHHYLGESPGSGSGSGVGPNGAGRSVSFSSPRGMRQGGGLGGGGINCQDCGNQAKKDCAHMRCRTCCRSRGFDCSTHVKSTWVPAAKRRERQQQLASAVPPALQQEDMEMRENQKRLRENKNVVVPFTRLQVSTASPPGLEVGQSFPPELSSPAVFRCVKVTSMDDADDQLAYQTAVSIGGHVFKGILYDQGPEDRYSGEGSGGGDSLHLQQHDLFTGGSVGGGGSSAAAAAATSGGATLLDSTIYPTPINAFLAGTQFFPPTRS